VSNFQKYVAKISAPYLVRLHALPRWVLPLFMTALLLVGLFANPAATAGFWLGLVSMLIIVGILVWLLTLSWPLLSSTSRVLRTFVALVLFAITLDRFIL
jgi:hypothetical protein